MSAYKREREREKKWKEDAEIREERGGRGERGG